MATGDDQGTPVSIRLSDATTLFKLFTPERYTNLVLCAVAFIILLFAAWLMIRAKDFGAEELGLIFGSTGLVTFSSNRLLKMWTDMVTIVFGSQKE